MKRLLFTVIIVTLGLIAGPAVNRVAADDGTATAQQKAVLVTGASTGIGRKITEVLAANGHFVFAGARKQKDLDALNALENVQAVRLDVTVQADIDAAVEVVRNSGKGLYGLVNNAGVSFLGPLIEVDVSELEWLFDVNVLGVYRITQAFAPMIIEQKGRITNIGSITGIVSTQFGGAYQMSKHAIEAYTDSLAMEMQRFDVGVSVIEPGNFKSALYQSGAKRMAEKDYVIKGSPYAEELNQWMSQPHEGGQYKEPDEVAEAALHALFDANPRRRYMVVPNKGEAIWTISKAIEEVVQLNQWQAYSFSRDELIQILDAVIAANRE